MAKKVYVLDTNIIMEDPSAIYGFEDNYVVLTGTVLQEMNNHKGDIGENGWHIRETVRRIEDMASRYQSDVVDFNLDNGGILKLMRGFDKYILPPAYSNKVADNCILNDVKHLESVVKKWDDIDTTKDDYVVLVTNDVAMRLNARTLGIIAQPYRNSQIVTNEIYTGRGTLSVPIEVIFELKRQMKNADNADYGEFGITLDLGGEKPHENQYFVFTNEALLEDENAEDKKVVCQYRNGKFWPIDVLLNPMGITQRNIGQGFALHALMAPVDDIPLVILDGRAGTAKTFLSLACGLDKVYGSYDRKPRRRNSENDDVFNKLVYTRPNQLSDRDHGYLKGDLFEKMMPLLGPAFDNLEQLIAGDVGEDPQAVKEHVEDLFTSGQIEALSMAYMRGRSISNAYLIVDECQNCTQSQIYDIISRAGEGTKVVLCGDSNQIDNPLLDKRNNGLRCAEERFKDSPLCAQIVFDGEGECVRSKLAAEATRVFSK